ncbi:MAG: VWA domain-containing protein [Akkermansiaceae bacterium]|nr:VWA domain-containing protein [Akkermansiaceae bacterium]
MIIQKLVYLLITASLTALGVRAEDHTLAPYFQIISADSATDSFPLKASKATVSISGTIAQVELRQTYANAGGHPMEAIYVFPGSTRSAVHGMEMKIGEKVIRAKIQEKQQARTTYEKAKAEHKTTSLLEQHRPNVFQMNVANILPGDEVEVLLRYTEQLVPTDGHYEFVMPTVAGPRFSNKAQDSENNWVANPYLKPETSSAAAPRTAFEFTMDLRTGLPLKQVYCTSHNNEVKYHGRQHAALVIDSKTDSTCMNRDIIVRYRLAGDAIETGLLLHQDEEDENFFLINVQPPARVTPANIPARDYLFVVDVSGSMNGFPLQTAGELFSHLAKGLRSTDTFNVLLFAGGSQTFANHPVQATANTVQDAIRFMTDTRRHGGGTQLVKALQRAVEMPGSAEKSRSIVVITDGYIDFEAEAFDLIRKNRGNANLFCFGIGSSVNRHLVEGIARIGAGEPFVVTHPGEARDTARRFKEYIESPVLTHVKVTTQGFDTGALQPSSMPDIFANRPVSLCGKWSGSPQGQIVITGLTGGGKKYEHIIDVAESVQQGSHNPALRSLWARERVRELADYAKLNETDEAVKEVTNLGLTYDLLTPYTSFVAVDESPRTPGMPLETVKQPSPLPKGVSTQAVSSGSPVVSGGSVPEPGGVALFFVSTLVILFLRTRRCPE